MPIAEACGPRLSGLIAHLYDAAVDEALWTGTAARIAETFGSDSTVLKLHGSTGSQVDLLECTENLVVSERQQEWAQDWHRNDLWVERSVAYGMSRVITDEDLVTRHEQERSGFYREWLHHLGIYHMLGAVFPAADGAIGVLGIHRPRGAGAYTEVERRQAVLLLPHLQRALRLGQRLAAAAELRTAGLQALDRIDTGVFLVDRSCRILHASAMAEVLMRENAELAVNRGRLSLRQAALQGKLLSLVRATIDTARGSSAGSGSALAVPRPHRLPLALEVAPLHPAHSAFGTQRPAVLIFIRDPEAPIAADCLRQLFGLTRTEGAVAAALARGSALEDIAARMGIGIATVRSHLKRILAKTGTHRQAEVVALLARSVSTSVRPS